MGVWFTDGSFSMTRSPDHRRCDDCAYRIVRALGPVVQPTFEDREERLRALGFEEVSAEQRERNLWLNLTINEWAK